MKQTTGPLEFAEKISQYRIAAMDAARGLVELAGEAGDEYRAYTDHNIQHAAMLLAEAMTSLGQIEAFCAGCAATNARLTRQAIDNELSSKTAYRA